MQFKTRLRRQRGAKAGGQARFGGDDRIRAAALGGASGPYGNDHGHVW
jgi:hypothetical protein